jgi:hypothetical protein
MSFRREVTEAVRGLMPNKLAPRAVSVTGPNPLSPSAPKRGVYGVSTWAVTTAHLGWKEGREPEGWDTLVAREAALPEGESLPPFIVIWDNGDGYCIPLDGACYCGLYSPPGEDRVSEAVDWIVESSGLCDDDYDDEEW